MSEELEGKQEEVKQEEEQQFPEAEIKAMEGGWRPKEEWEGDEEDWVSAKEFNQRGEYIDRIKSQTSQIKGLEKKLSKVEKVINDLAEHNQRLAEREFKDNKKALRDMKKEAMEIGDYDKVIEIDEKIDELQDLQKEQQRQEAAERQATQTGDMNPAVIDWLEANSWYESDPVLRGAFDAMAEQKVARDPSLRESPRELLKMVEQEVKKEFPHKFGGTRPRSTVTETGSNRSGSSSSRTKYTARDLNEVQKQIGQRFVDSGAMESLNQYAEQLAEMNELDVQKGGV